MALAENMELNEYLQEMEEEQGTRGDGDGGIRGGCDRLKGKEAS